MDDLDLRIVRALQDGLPVSREPYAAAARDLGVPVAALLARLRAMCERGEVRRMGASIAHRRAGFAANVMCAWRVAPEQAESFGAAAAGFDAVSHCYERATTPEWPYNVYVMIHGRTEADCESVVREIRERTGCGDYVELHSTEEFKKTWTRL
jgi:DNA-binding Lrp family transcriptional regulator